MRPSYNGLERASTNSSARSWSGSMNPRAAFPPASARWMKSSTARWPRRGTETAMTGVGKAQRLSPHEEAAPRAARRPTFNGWSRCDLSAPPQAPPLLHADREAYYAAHSQHLDPLQPGKGRRGKHRVHPGDIGEEQLQHGHGRHAAPQPRVVEPAGAPEGTAQA